MAIQNKFTTMYGIELPEAYIRLSEFITYRNRLEMQFKVYVNKQAYDENKCFIELIHKELGAGSPEIPEEKDEEGNIIKEAIPEVIGMENYFSIELLDGQTNTYKQAYLYLMSLPEYKNSVQV